VRGPLYFVVPWYPERTVGGAEALARHTVEELRRRGVDARVLTTCVPDFRSDWGVNALPKGQAQVGGAPVERFPVDRRDWRLFDQVNLRIMRGEPVTEPEARIYVEESIRSRALEDRLARLEPGATCVYMPYLHGTTYWGLRARPGWLWACLHDEPYAHLPPFRDAFARAEGVLCNAVPEAALVRRLFAPRDEAVAAVGVGVETTVAGDAARFRAARGLEAPFLLYVGRHDHGKNLDGLLADFGRYRARGGRMQLVRVGAGALPVPSRLREAVVDLGVLPEQEKLDAGAAATALCVPGVNESFSIVLMESWLLGRPGLVNADCAVTSDHVRAAAGGLAYRDADELGACLDWFLEHPEAAARMGQNGGAYVRRNFDWDVVVARLRRALAV
jgi:glycosyltransferase involved in cell wall biosynthesis